MLGHRKNKLNCNLAPAVLTLVRSWRSLRLIANSILRKHMSGHILIISLIVWSRVGAECYSGAGTGHGAVCNPFVGDEC